MNTEQEHVFLGLNSILFIGLVAACLLLGYMIRRYKFTYLPESAASMLVGVFVGVIIALFSKEESEAVMFDPEIFFFGLLPGIIFDAGFSVEKTNFFHNISSILLYAVGGTIVSTFVVAYGLFGLSEIGLLDLKDTTEVEFLIFGALISAVDPVATLAILGSDTINADPLLYSLVFGESVLNDAVAIALCRTFSSFTAGREFSILYAIQSFLVLCLGSILIGVVMALACAFLLHHTNLTSLPEHELSFILLFAYGSYCIAESVHLSGIFSLFFCAILMSHYVFYNMSSVGQTSSMYMFKSVATICETFVFAYLGITAGISFRPQFHLKWDIVMILSTIIFCLIGRAIQIFSFSFLANLCRNSKIHLRMQALMWFAGLRGAVSFALSLNVSTPNRPYFVTTTLCVVIFTTVICGGLTEPLLVKFGMQGHRHSSHSSLNHDQSDRKISVTHSMDEKHMFMDEKHMFTHPTSPGSPGYAQLSSNRKMKSFLKRTWQQIDRRFMQVWFGGPVNVHECDEDPDEVEMEPMLIRDENELSS